MMMLKLKKLFNRKEEMEIITETASREGISFRILENGDRILGVGDENKTLEYKYPLDYEQVHYGEIHMDKQNLPLRNILAYFIGNEVEKKSLAGEILDKYKELNIFYDLSEKISSNLDLNNTVRVAFEEAKRYIPSSYCLFLIKDDKEGILKKVFEFKESNPAQKVKTSSVLVDKILKSRISDIVEDISDSEFKGSCIKLKSLIFAPIHYQNNIEGVFIMGNEQKATYSSDDLKLFSAISFLLGVSIENRRLYKTLEDTFFQTVRALSDTIEKRDTYTGGHVQRVMEYCLIIGEAMGMSKEELDQLKLAALMHDIGKIGIEDSILRKSQRLSDEEYWVMKKHPVFGAEILQNIHYLKSIIPGVREHHERFDGLGYPDGLKGEHIHIYGRIIAVADTFDAMVSNRPYRKALPENLALRELEKYSGKQFDPEVVRVFIEKLSENMDI